MTPAQRKAREFLDRFNALTDEYRALANQTIDQSIDDEHPLDDTVILSWEARLAEITEGFAALERDVDAAIAGRGLPPGEFVSA